MNGRDVATVLWAYDALREGELRRLDGGREAWDSQAVQVPGGGVGRFPRSVADRAGMFAALDAALARTLPKMNGAELAQTPVAAVPRRDALNAERREHLATALTLFGEVCADYAQREKALVTVACQFEARLAEDGDIARVGHAVRVEALLVASAPVEA